MFEITSLMVPNKMEALTIEQYDSFNEATKSNLVLLEGIKDLLPRPL